MITRINELVGEQRQVLAKRVRRLREATEISAGRVKLLKQPVRAVAHSGVRLTTVSQRTLQHLIELESEAITSALTDAAERLERAAHADGVVDLVRHQAEMLGATRERLADEATRAVGIFRQAGRDVRTVGTRLYEKVVEPVEEELPKARARARKVASKVRKASARVH